MTRYKTYKYETDIKRRKSVKFKEQVKVYILVARRLGGSSVEKFVYRLWNVPIQIFAIFLFIILKVYNGFRYRKGWHSTSKQQLWHILGFHFY